MPRMVWVVVIAAYALIAIAIPAPTKLTAQTMPPQAPPVELPIIPDPVPVELDAATTAFLALDFDTAFCAPDPACLATLPAVQTALDAARTAGVLVIYSTPPAAAAPDDAILADVAPLASDAIVHAPADKFFRTNLEQLLQQANVKTAVVTGTYANGAVLYTAFELGIRGYTIVVAEDGISSPTDFRTFLARYQLLNPAGPGLSNPQNTPLKPTSVTLSRTDLISYR